MDLNTVYIRTAKGEAELGNEQLSLELHDILSRVDGKTGVRQMMQDAAFWSEQTFELALSELLEGGYVQRLSGTAIEEERAAPLGAAPPKEPEPPVEAARSAGKSKFAESKRTLIASVLFLDIVEYTKHPVADQFRMKEDFNRLVYQLVQKIPEDDRIIIDTGDGAALGFLADPEEVLFIAIRLRDTLEANGHQDYPDLYVRMGINLGPIKLVTDMNGRENLIGDGVNDASRIMGFAKGDQILISRSFHDVVSRLSSEHAGLFKYQGVHRDKHRREHEIYEVGGGTRADREKAAEEKTEETIRAERLAKMKAKLEAAAKAEADAKAARAAREALEAEARKQVQAKADKPRSAPRKKGRGIGRRVAIALALIIAATAGILPFVPLEFLAKDAERTVADKTGETVTVGSASLVLLPTPRIVLKAVSIGQDLKISKLTEILFGPKLVQVDGATIDQDAISGISNWKMPAQKVELEQVSLSLNGKLLPAFGGEVDFAEDGAFRHASINSEGMKAEIGPGESGVNIELDAKDWKLPLGPECPWAEIHARGIASGNEVRIASIEASGYGGDWSGSGKISWGDGWRANGSLKGKHFDIEQLLPYFSKGARLKGTLEFDAAVASSAANFNGLFDSPGIEATFRLRSGVVGNVDIAQAIQTPSPGGSSGGETRFDALSGSLSAAGRDYRYSGLKMTSGIMKVSGEFVLREGNLSGNMAVFLNQMHLPLRLGGSLAEPVLR